MAVVALKLAEAHSLAAATIIFYSDHKTKASSEKNDRPPVKSPPPCKKKATTFLSSTLAWRRSSQLLVTTRAMEIQGMTTLIILVYRHYGIVELLSMSLAFPPATLPREKSSRLKMVVFLNFNIFYGHQIWLIWSNGSKKKSSLEIFPMLYLRFIYKYFHCACNPPGSSSSSSSSCSQWIEVGGTNSFPPLHLVINHINA